MNNTLISKQLVLLNTLSALASAAATFEEQEILIYTKDSNGSLMPIANEAVQGLVLTDSVISELRGGALEAFDMAVTQLEALGITISDAALTDIKDSSN